MQVIGETGGIFISVRQHFEDKDRVYLTNLIGVHGKRTPVLSYVLILPIISSHLVLQQLAVVLWKDSKKAQVH